MSTTSELAARANALSGTRATTARRDRVNRSVEERLIKAKALAQARASVDDDRDTVVSDAKDTGLEGAEIVELADARKNAFLVHFGLVDRCAKFKRRRMVMIIASAICFAIALIFGLLVDNFSPENRQVAKIIANLLNLAAIGFAYLIQILGIGAKIDGDKRVSAKAKSLGSRIDKILGSSNINVNIQKTLGEVMTQLDGIKEDVGDLDLKHEEFAILRFDEFIKNRMTRGRPRKGGDTVVEVGYSSDEGGRM